MAVVDSDNGSRVETLLLKKKLQTEKSFETNEGLEGTESFNFGLHSLGIVCITKVLDSNSDSAVYNSNDSISGQQQYCYCH